MTETINTFSQNRGCHGNEPNCRTPRQFNFQSSGKLPGKRSPLATIHNLTQAEFRCLRLFGTDESVNNKKIAERMNLSPSRLTRIIDGLVEKEYILREIDPEDRRNMRVMLSKRGRQLVNQLNKAYVQIHSEILQDIEISQHEPLIIAMQHLLEALENWLKKPEK